MTKTNTDLFDLKDCRPAIPPFELMLLMKLSAIRTLTIIEYKTLLCTRELCV